MITYEFSGRISSISKDGRSGVVLLFKDVLGKKFAIVSGVTVGRVKLMNPEGKLKVGTVVSGKGIDGVDALIAETIEKCG